MALRDEVPDHPPYGKGGPGVFPEDSFRLRHGADPGPQVFPRHHGATHHENMVVAPGEAVLPLPQEIDGAVLDIIGPGPRVPEGAVDVPGVGRYEGGDAEACRLVHKAVQDEKFFLHRPFRAVSMSILMLSRIFFSIPDMMALFLMMKLSSAFPLL